MTTEELNEDGETFSINLTLRDSDGGEYVLRQVALGFKPIILIEPEYDEDEDHVTLSVDATDCTQEELAQMLELVVTTLREGTVKEDSE